MKKAISILGIMFLAVSGAFAQTQPNQPGSQKQPPMSAEQRAQMRTAKLSQLLQLSEQQKKTMYTVNLTAAQKEEVAMKNHDKQQFMQVSADRDNQYKTILTPQQYEKYQSLLHKPAPNHMAAPAPHK